MSRTIGWMLVIIVTVSTTLTITSFFVEPNLTVISMVLNSIALSIAIINLVYQMFKKNRDTPTATPNKKRINGRVDYDGNSIIVTPIILQDGESSMKITPGGIWVREEGILITRDDYERLYPNGRSWKITAPRIVSELSELLATAKIGDDIQLFVTAVVIARKEGTQKEYLEMLLALDQLLDAYCERDVFLPINPQFP